MVIFDEEDMKWAMEVFNIGKVVYPVPVEDNKNTVNDLTETDTTGKGTI